MMVHGDEAEEKKRIVAEEVEGVLMVLDEW